MFPAQQRSNDTLDYAIQWNRWLGTATMTTSVWSVATTPSGPVLSDEEIVGTKTGVTITGGVAGEIYEIENTITVVSDGDTLSRTETIELYILP